jgi:hypothetical protein
VSCEYSATVTATAPIDTPTAVWAVNAPILVVGVLGEVVTELVATSTTYGTLSFVPSGGSPEAFAYGPEFGDAIGGGGYSTVAAGMRFAPQSPSSAAGIVTDGALAFGCSFHLPPGEIAVQFPHSGGSPSGAVKWTLWYRPLDPGASVTAL